MYRNNCNETYYFDDYNKESTDFCECPCRNECGCDDMRNDCFCDDDFANERECEQECKCMVGPTGPMGLKGSTGLQGPRGLHASCTYAKPKKKDNPILVDYPQK